MLTHKHTIICEHARLEMSGRWTLIGVMPNVIATPMIPFPLPMLTFFHVFDIDAPANLKFTANLTELTTGNKLAQAQGAFPATQAGAVHMQMGLGNLQFKAFGVYHWLLEIEGQGDPMLTEFSVVHQQQQPLRIVPPPPRR
jgi:hypothetical protein